MKNIYAGKPWFAIQALFFYFIIVSNFSGLYAQTYYSDFSAPTQGIEYSSSKPSGILCALPDFSNTVRVADNDLTNFSTVSGTVGASLVCNSSNQYSIRAKIRFPNGMTSAPAGYSAGFRLQLNTLLSLNILQNSISLRTYLQGQPQQLQPGIGLLGLSLLSTSSTAADISFQPTSTFDEVEAIVATNVLDLNTSFTYNFYYAMAISPVVLPLKLSTFSAARYNSVVRLAWTVASQADITRYEVERSDDASSAFISVGSVTAKLSTGASYSYNDGTALAKNYLYRLKMVHKDGVTEYSKVLAFANTANTNWTIYPTVLTAGISLQLNVSNSTISRYSVRIMSMQGQPVATYTMKGGQITIPTQKLSSGLYLLMLYSDNQVISSKKFMVQ